MNLADGINVDYFKNFKEEFLFDPKSIYLDFPDVEINSGHERKYTPGTNSLALHRVNFVSQHYMSSTQKLK